MSGETRLVALDVDGTVLGEDGSLADEVRDAVRAAATGGDIVTLATGRSWDSTHPVLEMLGLEPEYVVCANGALVMKRDAAEESGYRRHLIETFDARPVLETIHASLDDGRYMVELPDGFRKYTEGMVDWTLDNAEKVPFERLYDEPVMRVVVVSPGQDEQEFLESVERMGLHQVAYSIGWTAWLDIAPQGVNKSTALEHVREALDIPSDRVLVAGDGRNDIEMFEWAVAGGGTAVAMGQAPDEVLAAANTRTAPITENGLAFALREHLAR
ncbi:Cof subfamily protein (haloacid dehalogenase superfamily)/HAD superfamily hydrolase (TIGR01484 family) [Labedella gwakjiensis]|uniref:Cof subfamily protein (Haloacid dehalogenase superfamily)/HAD superfamily hydrolase (TIGR01484 family) n=1 Tax=Labedella gwakjiensis TaxID=390269 RepID=A0A2P8GWE9_9MICO|nr:HAD family hydrolase [Labedella gwakjiensis]PSL38286.1 Cof subfamily protein (haloacid dehalogenase superfamily)/HAD superfamily hydrolase (TIGR01484 family) [Labedella gwakjiensis]RUQ87176.1 HAD family hydrolase [Labedella gwakjiensis]